jgi:hypothetical protein
VATAARAETALIKQEAAVLLETKDLFAGSFRGDEDPGERLLGLEGRRAVLCAERVLAYEYRLDCERLVEETFERLLTLCPHFIERPASSG